MISGMRCCCRWLESRWLFLFRNGVASMLASSSLPTCVKSASIFVGHSSVTVIIIPVYFAGESSKQSCSVSHRSSVSVRECWWPTDLCSCSSESLLSIFCTMLPLSSGLLSKLYISFTLSTVGLFVIVSRYCQ